MVFGRRRDPAQMAKAEVDRAVTDSVRDRVVLLAAQVHAELMELDRTLAEEFRSITTEETQ